MFNRRRQDRTGRRPRRERRARVHERPRGDAGQRGGLSSLGLVGFLVQQSPNVGRALHGLVRYLHLHVRGAMTTLAVYGDLAMLGDDIYQPQVEATRQIGDGAVAVMFNIMRTLCGTDWKPIEVLFAHRKPENLEPFRRFFEAPLRFDAEQNALQFPADWVEHPVATGRGPLRDSPADARRFCDGGEPHCCVARLFRRKCLHAGISALERHHTHPLAGEAQCGEPPHEWRRRIVSAILARLHDTSARRWCGSTRRASGSHW
jgi:hypothetical protein